MIGKQRGHLKVISSAGQDKYRNYIWNCLCDCMQMTIVRSSTLNTATENITCGHCKQILINQKEYHAWEAMKQRCYNKNNPRYKDYGGRGIIVCKEWINDFQKFLQDVGNAPSSNSVLDRIDNDKNYEYNNVEWTTYKISGNNQRRYRVKRAGVCR